MTRETAPVFTAHEFEGGRLVRIRIASRSRPDTIYQMVRWPTGWSHEHDLCEAALYSVKCWHRKALEEYEAAIAAVGIGETK